MTLVQLSYIVALDDEKNFVKASEKVFVTQPTLSMQIQKLESDLGIQIFDRSKQPILTTELGSKIIQQARIILRETQKINEIIFEENNEISGNLKIGIIPTLAPYLLPLFIHKLFEQYPKINIELEEIQTAEIIDKLKKDKIDVGILALPLYDKEIKEIFLFEEEFVAYISPHHYLNNRNNISNTDLYLDDIWLLKEGHCFRDNVINICNNMNGKSENNRIKFEAGSLETLQRMVEIGHGMTLLPKIASSYINEVEKLKYIHSFDDPIPTRKIGLAIHRSFAKKRKIELLQQIILENIHL